MKNYKLEISYDGTSYSGWQIQKNDRTIQGCIESALKKILKIETVNLVGSGRTDSGVHANNQTANIILSTNMNCDQIRRAINTNIPNDIFISKCKEIDLSFNSRFDALKREYIYYITNDFSPMKRFYFWQNNRTLNKDKLVKCANLIIGENDFSLFSKSSSETKNKICIIYESNWTFNDGFLSYKIIGNRFLQHMVRLIVGTMLEVSLDRITFDDFSSMLKCKKVKATALRAPARGLFLNKIYYE